jgi:nicotinamidase-related amidase
MPSHREIKSVEFTLPARYYARGGVDLSSPVPAKGYRGEKTRQVTLDTANTAIICMHPENTTYPGGPVILSAEPGTRAYYDDWFAQYKIVVEQHLAPLFGAARQAGMRILYNVNGWRSAEKYPQYVEIRDRVKPPRDWKPPVSPNLEWRKECGEDVYGKDFRVEGECDIAPPIAARPEDWLVWWDYEASTLLHEHGIWNILFTGFESASCFLNIPGGVLSMCQLGYRCFIVEDCSLAMETRETQEQEEIKNGFFKAMQLVRYCYLVNGKDIIQSLVSAKGEGHDGR